MGGRKHFQVRVGKAEREVFVATAKDGGTEAQIGDERYLVDHGPDGDVLVVRVSDGKQFRVELDPARPPKFGFADGHALALEVVDARDVALGVAGGARKSGGAKVISPMPGRIVRVLVAPGDAVKVGDPAIVVEAMKMENELRIDSEGVVARVAVAPGDKVDAGQVLCEIAAHPASE